MSHGRTLDQVVGGADCSPDREENSATVYYVKSTTLFLAAAANLARVMQNGRIMLNDRLPKEWQEAGARFGADGLLYLSEWRRGFTANELRALFWTSQQVRALEAETRRLQREKEQLMADLDAAEARATWYRRQCTLEARMGLVLQRIAN